MVKMRRKIPAVLLLACVARAAAPVYLDPKQPVEARVEDLLARMTLEEKVGQMNMPCVYVRQMGGVGFESRVLDAAGVKSKLDACRRFSEGTYVEGLGPGGGFFTLANTVLYEGPQQQARFFNELQKIAMEKTRLKIPLLQTEEGTHGLMCSGSTIFPEGPGLGSVWDMDLIRDIYSGAAKEARAVGVHQLYTLVVEPTRDPRLGRNQEGYSEDPFLCSNIAEAIVRGTQGSDVSAADKVVAGLCHYPGQSQPVGGLERGAMEISQRMLREVFLPPWVAGIKHAGALGVMATYPAIDGVPTHASAEILTRILREELEFKGLVLGEGGGIETLVSEHVVPGQKEAGQAALRAGLDVGISFEQGYMRPLIESVKEGKASVELVDRAVRRILRLKFMLGLFERPYVDPERAAAVVRNPPHRELTLRAARESIVLLKNDKDLLPLKKDLKTVAVIGPNADNGRNQLGDYVSRVILQQVTTVLDGVKKKLPNSTVRYAKGLRSLRRRSQRVREGRNSGARREHRHCSRGRERALRCRWGQQRRGPRYGQPGPHGCAGGPDPRHPRNGYANRGRAH